MHNQRQDSATGRAARPRNFGRGLSKPGFFRPGEKVNFEPGTRPFAEPWSEVAVGWYTPHKEKNPYHGDIERTGITFLSAFCRFFDPLSQRTLRRFPIPRINFPFIEPPMILLTLTRPLRRWGGFSPSDFWCTSFGKDQFKPFQL